MPPIPEDKILSINIKTYGSFVKLPVNHLAGHTVISIDVLRSSSCIVWGLVNSASKIIPVDDLGSAVSIASRMGDCVLAGERGAVLIPGFDIGNSPAEYTEARVGGKAVVISTTNGTGAICKSESASNVLIGSMLNCTAVAKQRGRIGKRRHTHVCRYRRGVLRRRHIRSRRHCLRHTDTDRRGAL